MRRRIAITSLLIAVTVVAAAWAVGVPSGGSGVTGQPENLGRMILYASLALVFSFLCSVAELSLIHI